MNILFVMPHQEEKVQPLCSHQGIMSLSSFLKQQDTSIKTALLKLGNLDTVMIGRYVKDFRPDLFCITSTSLEIKLASAIGSYIRKTYRLPVVLGGIHATLKPEECLAQNSFDAVCRAEGEEALFEFTGYLKNSEMRYDIKNFYFKTDDSIVSNPLRPRIEDLDRLPYPDRELFHGPPNKEVTYAEFLGSRGCAFSCAYCATEYLRNLYENKSIRFKSAEYLINEIKEFLKFYPNLSFITFHDDNFNLNKNWLLRFCELYSENFAIPFCCNLHFNLIDEDIVRALKKANCYRAHVAIETGNEAFRRKVLNKHVSNNMIIKSIELLRKYGIHIWTFNILGFPSESEEHTLETIMINKKVKPDYLFVSCFYSLPGSKLYDEKFSQVSRTYQEACDSYFVDYSRYYSEGDIKGITYYRNLFPFVVFYPYLVWLMKIRCFNAFFGKLLYSPLYEKNFLLYRARSLTSSVLKMIRMKIKSFSIFNIILR